MVVKELYHSNLVFFFSLCTSLVIALFIFKKLYPACKILVGKFPTNSYLQTGKK